MVIHLFFFPDNKQAVIAVLQSNSELVKDALSELDEVLMCFTLFCMWTRFFQTPFILLDQKLYEVLPGFYSVFLLLMYLQISVSVSSK